MAESKKSEPSLNNLILITSPLWVLVVSTAIAFVVRGFYFPLGLLGKSRLAVFFLLMPAAASLLVGIFCFYRMLKLPRTSGALSTLLYALVAVVVQFFAIFSASMTLGL